MKHFLITIGLVSLLIVACSSCATTKQFEATYGSWVGAPLKAFEAAYGPLQPVGTDGENVIYKYKMKRMRDCTIYWTVSKDGVIIKWRHEGADCALAPFS